MPIPAGGRPEDRARANIDRLLTAAGWLIQNRDSINIEAGRGVAIREFPLAPGHGFADYLLYIDGYAAGVIETKKEGVPLVAVEIQTAITAGISTTPDCLPPLPISSTKSGMCYIPVIRDRSRNPKLLTAHV
jgi:type I restriction enzyme R subunit